MKKPKHVSKIVLGPTDCHTHVRTRRCKFPWRVGTNDRTKEPLIVDALGYVVAQIMSGGFEAAEKIVAGCNRDAEINGWEEL